MIKVVVFDFDGVLVDSDVVKYNAYFDIFTPLGATHPIVKQVLKKNPGEDRYQIIERILRRLVRAGFLSAGDQTDELVRKYAGQYNDICEEYAVTCPEITEASSSLPLLAKRYLLYINSATPEEPLRRVVRQRGWESYFQEVLGRPCTKVENLVGILEREKIAGSETLFVGNGQQDLETASQCRCWFVGLLSDTSHFKCRPSYTIRKLSEIETVISQIKRRMLDIG